MMTAGAVPFALGAAASVATMSGGIVALRMEARVVLLLALAAGLVVGVALFDLVPEALNLGAALYGPRSVLVGVAAGVIGYMLLDRFLTGQRGQTSRLSKHIGPASLTVHSLFDGLSIGLAFQVGSGTGWVVAFAVLTHDFADGLNTVSLSLLRGSPATAKKWLLADSLAPLLGVALSQVIDVPTGMFAPLLSVFAGALLYIGACQLMPRSYELGPHWRTSVSTIVGIAIMYVTASLAG